MSTTNKQSIQQINTAALRGTREAHQPDVGQSRKKQKISLLKNQFRGDFEILDEAKKCRGFVWRYGKRWVVRVDDRPAQYRTSRKGAVELARELVAGPVQPVHDLEAAAQYLASYIRMHAAPLNKMEGK